MRCALREVRDEDLEVLFEQWADPVAAGMAAFTSPDHMEWDAFERRWARIRADEPMLARVIVLDDDVAGTIGSWGDPGEREVTYWIGRAYWGRGIATEARSGRPWPLIGPGRSTPTSPPTTSGRGASSRSADSGCRSRDRGTGAAARRARSYRLAVCTG
jgi:hypothetical protein